MSQCQRRGGRDRSCRVMAVSIEITSSASERMRRRRGSGPISSRSAIQTPPPVSCADPLAMSRKCARSPLVLRPRERALEYGEVFEVESVAFHAAVWRAKRGIGIARWATGREAPASRVAARRK